MRGLRRHWRMPPRSRRNGKRGRKAPAEMGDDAEADARVKAFFARMMRPPGTS